MEKNHFMKIGPEDMKVIVQSGEELANKILEDALRSAPDSEKFSISMEIIRISSIHLLASQIGNMVIQGLDENLAVTSVVNELKAKVALLKDTSKYECVIKGPEDLKPKDQKFND